MQFFPIIFWFMLCVDHVTCVSKKKSELQKKLFLRKLTSSLQQYDVSKNCSLERSALIYKILLKDFYPVFNNHEVNIPKQCPFNSQLNIFGEFENYKMEVTPTNWQCGLCGKKFYSESYLHNHMIRKHATHVKKDKTNICLAVYCDIFRCDLHEQYPHINRNEKCDSKRVRDIQRKCEKTIQACLPNDLRNIFYEKLHENLCSTLTCSSFYQPFDELSIYWILGLCIGIPISAFIAVYALVFYLEQMELSQIEDPVSDYKRELRRIETSVVTNNNRRYFYDKPPITRRR